MYLVTGASGFVGRTLCRRLGRRGRVRALLRRPVAGAWDEAVTVDLATGQALDEAVRGVDTVFHLAALAHDATLRADARLFRLVNVDATRRLLEASERAGVRRFIYLSSVKAMGEGGPGPVDESLAAAPRSIYGRSKRQAEKLVLEDSRIEHRVVLRASLVYGAGVAGNIARMIRAVDRGVFPPLPAVRNYRSMVHVEDLARALVLAAEKSNARGRTFIVTDGHAYTSRQMYEWISNAMDRRIPTWTLPAMPLRVAARIGDGVARVIGRPFLFDSSAYDKLLGHAHYDSSLIVKALGYEPRHNFKDSIPEMVASVRG